MVSKCTDVYMMTDGVFSDFRFGGYEMGIYERKEREKNERRSLILDSARRLIFERGVDSVSMQDIANDCELSKGALYLYFDNKESLLRELFHEAGTQFIGYVQDRIKPTDSGLQAIRTLWLIYLELFGESIDIIVLFGVNNALTPGFPWILDSTKKDDEGSESDSTVLVKLFEQLIARGVSDGSLVSSLDPVRVARSIFVIAGGIVDNIARLPLEMRNHKIILEEMKAILEIVLRGLASPSCDPALLQLPLN